MLDSQEGTVSHETFFATVLTETGKVKPIGEGNDGARQVIFKNGIKATLKPKLFKTEGQYGIAPDTQYLREAAAYQFDRQLLGWGLVPPTTLTVYQNKPASIMAWVAGVQARDLAPKLFQRDTADRKGQAALLAAKVNTDALRRVVLFDLLINNTDRHGRNLVFDTFSNRVWAIDNGNTFGRYMEGYYQVFHRLLWPRRLMLTEDERALLQGITLEAMDKALGRYLTPGDIRMAHLRVQWVLAQANLGFNVLSNGQSAMPGYRAWFLKEIQEVVPSEVTRTLRRWGANSLTSRPLSR